MSAIHERAEIRLTFRKSATATERPDIQVLLYGHYRIAYLTTAERAIEILGVFHSALDMGRYLKPGG